MTHERLKTCILSSLLAAIALISIVCGGQTEAPPSPTPTSAPPTATHIPPSPAPTFTAIPAPPSPTPTPKPPSPTPVPTATVVPASPTPAVQPADAVLEEKAFAFLQYLTDEFSPRESATDEELAAAHFLRNRLEEFGYDVYIQDFDVSRLMAEVSFSADSAAQDSIRTFPIAESIEGTKTGMLADAGKAFEEDIPAEGFDGKVALIERGTITFEEKVTRVADAGAVGAIIFNNVGGNFGGRFYDQSTIPAVSLARADGLKLLDMIERGETEATVSVEQTARPSRNVIAEKRGASDSGETVVVGAHYDTTPNTQGANDNGSGVSVAMTMAELVADTEYPFTVRFVLFGAEEIGLFGSRHYVEALSEREIEDIVAMLNFDVPGSGDRLDFEGSEELMSLAEDIVEDIGARASRIGLPEGASSDHAPFYEAGVPVIFTLANDLSRINSPEDDIKWINPTLMGWATDLGIRLLERLAQEERR